MRSALPFLVSCLCAAACAPLGAPVVPCNQDGDCPSTQACVAGACALDVDDELPALDAGPASASEDGGSSLAEGGSSTGPVDSGESSLEPDAGQSASETDAGADLEPDGGALPGDWSLPAWRHRLRLEIAWSGAPLAGFPVLVELSADEVSALDLSADGRDVRVVDALGEPLPHELIHLDESGASLWVRAPLLEEGAALFVYGKNAAAEDASDPAAVFGEGYRSVWHLEGDARDSLGLATGAVDPGVTFEAGALGRAARFDGASRIDLGAELPHVQGAEGATLSLWLSRESDAAAELLSLSAAAPSLPNHSRISLGLNQAGGLKIFGREEDGLSSSRTVSLDEAAPLDAWVHVAGVFDVANARLALFVDGAEVASGSFEDAFSASRFPDTSSPYASLGSDDDGEAFFLTGLLDEARVADVARPAAWIAAEHQSRGGGLVRKGVVEARP